MSTFDDIMVNALSIQVFKYKRRGFDMLRTYIGMRNSGRATPNNLRFYFSSYFLKQVGDIRVSNYGF